MVVAIWAPSTMAVAKISWWMRMRQKAAGSGAVVRVEGCALDALETDADHRSVHCPGKSHMHGVSTSTAAPNI